MKEDKYRLLLIGNLPYFLNGIYLMNLIIILRVLWLCFYNYFVTGSTIRAEVHLK